MGEKEAHKRKPFERPSEIRMWVVDDHQHIANTIASICEHAGYESKAWNSGLADARNALSEAIFQQCKRDIGHEHYVDIKTSPQSLLDAPFVNNSFTLITSMNILYYANF